MEEIIRDTMRQLSDINIDTVDIDERIYNCTKVLTMLRMLKAAVGIMTAEMAEMQFVTEWTLRCARQKKAQIEFGRELEKTLKK